ncbi:MAG: hypothetical protein PUK18_00945 [Firmicutes bacterium]|nr:hypothetical protein [Bacillota bacterium]MDY6159761.1 hypothetical protein [Candidatus Faecousia sp.]
MEKKITWIISGVLALALIVTGVLFIQEKQANDARVQELESTLSQQASEIAALNADAAEKDSQIEALSADAADKASQIEALNADSVDKDSQIEALSADVAERDSQIEALNADAADKASQIEALNADAAEKNSQIEALNADAAEKASQIEALNADVADKASQIEALNAQLEQQASATQKPEIPASVPGEYASTREFLYQLEQEDIIYDYGGIDTYNGNKEKVSISFECGGHDIDIRFWFPESNDDVSIRVWDVISYRSAVESSVIRACNELNNTYRFVTFEADSNDCTVTLSMDLIVRPEADIGDITMEAMVRVYSILKEAYSTLDYYD